MTTSLEALASLGSALQLLQPETGAPREPLPVSTPFPMADGDPVPVYCPSLQTPQEQGTAQAPALLSRGPPLCPDPVSLGWAGAAGAGEESGSGERNEGEKGRNGGRKKARKGRVEQRTHGAREELWRQRERISLKRGILPPSLAGWRSIRSHPSPRPCITKRAPRPRPVFVGSSQPPTWPRRWGDAPSLLA